MVHFVKCPSVSNHDRTIWLNGCQDPDLLGWRKPQRVPELVFENSQCQDGAGSVSCHTIYARTVSEKNREHGQDCDLRSQTVSVVKHSMTMPQDEIQQNRGQEHPREERNFFW